MAQLSILSMFKKAEAAITQASCNNRRGEPITKIWTGNPDQESESGQTNTEVAITQTSDKNRSGKPIIGSDSGQTVKNRHNTPVESDNGQIKQNRLNTLVGQGSSAPSKKRKLENSGSSQQSAKKCRTLDTNPTAEKQFQMSWLNEFKWLQYKDGAMFCNLCVAHKNKSKFSSLSGSTNFRVSTLKEHESSSGHVKSQKLETERQNNQLQSVKDTMCKNTDKIESAVCRLIRTAYTVAKSNLPIEKYKALCDLQLCNDTQLTQKLYQDSSACTEFIELISAHFDENLLGKLAQSPAIGIMIVESTDISQEKHLIVYVNYLEDGELRTSYLSLIKLVSADSNAVYSSLVGYLKACNIDVAKIYGFSSDGAAVMMGKQNGVATKLKADNPFMLEIHCIAHRLALSSLDAAKEVKEVAYYEGSLNSIYSFFSRSSKRMEHLRTWQDVLDDPKVKPQQVHQVRWLSFSNCVSNVLKSLPSLLNTLEAEGEDDFMASSILLGMRSYKFLFLTHFFADIMSDIASVSKTFQSRDITYSKIKSTLQAVCDSIEQQYLVDDAQYGMQLRTFIDKYEHAFTYHDFEIIRSHKDERLPLVVHQFASVLKDSLLERFPKIEIWEAMSIFCPASFPEEVKEKAKFGNEKLAILTDHFGKERQDVTPPIDTCDAKREWPIFKNHMFSLSKKGTQDTSSLMSESELSKAVLSSKELIDVFPNLTRLMAICRILPASSVECERGFSVQNLIKTRLRSRLSIERLDELMRVSINGPNLESFDPVPCFRLWRGRKARHIYAKNEKGQKLT